MIKIEGVSKKYNEEFALKDVSLEVQNNKILTIIGPSGSGKSTLLRIIIGLEESTSGSVYISGTKLTKKNRHKLCIKLGMVFQHCHLFNHMNVMDNLVYAPKQRLGISHADAQVKAEELLRYFGMQDKADAMPSRLSGGQKQRVAIARAVMMDPEVILFDEPTSALDPEVIKDVKEAILELKSKMAVVVVTHHLKFAHSIADKVIFMDQGQVLCNQDANKFFAEPKSHRARLFLENVGDFM